ncbi:hypothetical protein F2Q69_00021239 [Brassica cretica]|uniref:Transposase-associated domain-containing protein n=1 Tax=Brassica cretica TaxID=69181 RepID=A0A8S9QA05_BRACR|nr:hypothetical protein F2Q69_00021239 [Brassica cretica]
MSFYFQSREWMDQRIDPESNQVSEIFLGGVDAFIQFACNQEDYKERETLLCLCARCKNVKQREARVVARHLFLYGFKGNYYFWTSHGEKFNDVGESSGANHSTGEEEMLETPIWNAYEDHQQNIPEPLKNSFKPWLIVPRRISGSIVAIIATSNSHVLMLYRGYYSHENARGNNVATSHEKPRLFLATRL